MVFPNASIDTSFDPVGKIDDRSGYILTEKQSAPEFSGTAEDWGYPGVGREVRFIVFKVISPREGKNKQTRGSFDKPTNDIVPYPASYLAAPPRGRILEHFGYQQGRQLAGCQSCRFDLLLYRSCEPGTPIDIARVVYVRSLGSEVQVSACQCHLRTRAMSCIVHQYWSTQRICLADSLGYLLQVEHFIAAPSTKFFLGEVPPRNRAIRGNFTDLGFNLCRQFVYRLWESLFLQEIDVGANGINPAQTVSFGLLQDCLVGPVLRPKQVETTWSISQKIGIGLQHGAASHRVGRARKEGSSWKEFVRRSALRTAYFACKLKCSQNQA